MKYPSWHSKTRGLQSPHPVSRTVPTAGDHILGICMVQWGYGSRFWVLPEWVQFLNCKSLMFGSFRAWPTSHHMQVRLCLGEGCERARSSFQVPRGVEWVTNQQQCHCVERCVSPHPITVSWVMEWEVGYISKPKPFVNVGPRLQPSKNGPLLSEK